jgi:hypothetical protein
VNALDYPLATEIERLLDTRVPATDAAAGARSRVEGPMVRGERSAIYRATCPGFQHPLFIKRPFETGRTARSQYDALDLARHRLRGQQGLLVPDAYPYLLDDGLIMMDWFAAATVGQLLNRPTLPVSRIVAAIERTGEWLRAFHGDGPQEFARLQVDQLLGHTVELAGDRRAAGDAARFRDLLQLLVRTAPQVRELSVPASYSHGDFKPDNVLIDGRRVIAIDIARVFKAPVVYDLAHFLVHLDLHLLHPAGWRFLLLRRRLHTAFLRGYRLSLTRSQAMALSWLALQRSLQSFYEEIGDPNRAKGWVRGNFLRNAYLVCARLRAQQLKSMSKGR